MKNPVSEYLTRGAKRENVAITEKYEPNENDKIKILSLPNDNLQLNSLIVHATLLIESSFSRRMHIFTGACMYLLPMIIYDVNYFIISFCMLLFGCSIFVLNDKLMGYGSALFHLLLIPYHKNIITYINKY